MNSKPVVLDSGVYAKVFLQEDGRSDVIELLGHIGDNAFDVLCPDIFLYEVLSIAAQNDFPLLQALGIIRRFENSYLTIVPLTRHQLELAMRMAEDGNKKADFPSIYDSAYHALAISCDGVFITADKRHVSKARQYGNVVLLENWQQAFHPIKS